MKLECEAYRALCELSKFTINGINAHYDDFGTKEDRDPKSAPDYCCADMRFIPYPSINLEALKKYNITSEEYNEVCKILEDKLSFGACGWCE